MADRGTNSRVGSAPATASPNEMAQDPAKTVEVTETMEMLKLRAHYDGQTVVLDDPPPACLEANTSVEVLIPNPRNRALAEWEAFSREFWARPLPLGSRPISRTWRREDLYERGTGSS